MSSGRDSLFDIDPEPFRTALSAVEARLAAAKVEFANLREAYSANEQQIIGQDAVDVRKSEFDRKAVLLKGKAETGVDRDNALPAYVQARRIRTFVRRQQAATSARLGGGLQASIEQFPAFTQAKAQLEDARRRLRNTSIVASIEGIATQTAPGLRG